MQYFLIKYLENTLLKGFIENKYNNIFHVCLFVIFKGVLYKMYANKELY